MEERSKNLRAGRGMITNQSRAESMELEPGGRRGAADAALLGKGEDVEEGGSSVIFSDRDSPSTIDHEETVVENFHLQSGAEAVSIMQLQMCIDENEVVSEGSGIQNVYLVGQTVSGSKEIRVLAEKFTLNFHPNYAPRFLVRTPSDWIRVQKPKAFYRQVMGDGLTLAHFIHYVRQHPSSSTLATKRYLAMEFRKFGERPYLEKLSDFFPVIRRFVEMDMEVEKASVLQEFFPRHFQDLIASQTIREESKGTCQVPKMPHNNITTDLNQKILDEVVQGHERKEAKCSSSLMKASKPQRVSVQAELRNLHSQWCSLLGGRATGTGGTKPVSKKPRMPEKPQNPRKSLPSEHLHPLSKSIHPMHHQPERDLVSSVQLQTSTLTEQKKSNLVVTLPKEDALKSKVKTISDKQKKGFIKQPAPTSGDSASCPSTTPIVTLPKTKVQKPKAKVVSLKRESNYMEQSASDSGDSAPGPPARKGVHSPCKDVIHQLEDPPICTICDDGGDLISCKGQCNRYFHATPGADTWCRTLGLTLEQMNKMDKYYCTNCLLRQHQCFICDELGSSASSPVEHQKVYMCDAPGCRKFYHEGCVAKAIEPGLDWTALAERIKRGLHGFLCPRHSCAVCESKDVQPGTFVQCRRCPKAWHRDCLTDFAFSGELPTTTIWKYYNREFIYCKEHKLLGSIQKPEQDHLRFPEK